MSKIVKTINRFNPFRKKITIEFDTTLLEQWVQDGTDYLISGKPDGTLEKLDLSVFDIKPVGWYYSVENIPNQNMIHDVYDYFDTGKRKDFMEPHRTIGIFHIFYTWFVQFMEHPSEWLQFVRIFDFTPEQQHVLFGIILYWHGGYPTIDRFSGQHQSALRFLEREFLKYEDDTPEKEFCQAKPVFRDNKWWMEKKTLDNEKVELIELNGLNQEDKPADTFTEIDTPTTSETKRTKEFTITRQVMTVYYLCVYLKVWGRIDKTKILDFIRFLTDKSKDEIYRKMSNPIEVKKNPRNTLDDYDFIIPYFENLGLDELVKLIKNDRKDVEDNMVRK